MIDGGTLKRHFSDLVSASATKNQSDITLIDPFQLVDFRTRILPEHLYPKFRLQLEKFKNQNPDIDITEVPDDQSQDQIDADHPQDLTEDQRIERALGKENPDPIDEFIRKIVENARNERINFPADLTNIQKPRSFNKKNDKKGEKKSDPSYREPIRIQPQEEPRTDSSDPGVDNQQSYKEPVQVHPEILKNGSSKSAEAHVDKSRGKNLEEIQGNLRKSTRITKLSAKALDMLTNQPQLEEASVFRKNQN